MAKKRKGLLATLLKVVFKGAKKGLRKTRKSPWRERNTVVTAQAVATSPSRHRIGVAPGEAKTNMLAASGAPHQESFRSQLAGDQTQATNPSLV
jgi:hypothetical protein